MKNAGIENYVRFSDKFIFATIMSPEKETCDVFGDRLESEKEL